MRPAVDKSVVDAGVFVGMLMVNVGNKARQVRRVKADHRDCRLRQQGVNEFNATNRTSIKGVTSRRYVYLPSVACSLGLGLHCLNSTSLARTRSYSVPGLLDDMSFVCNQCWSSASGFPRTVSLEGEAATAPGSQVQETRKDSRRGARRVRY